jgi:phosphotransferase system  glucose/maltose/N-acetylglucosamine-specific IIC component
MTGAADPAGDLPPVTDPTVQRLLDGVREHRPEAELLELGRGVDLPGLDRLIADSQDEITRLDRAWGPVLKAVEQAATTAGPSEAGGRAAQRYGVEARRYRAESRLNQGLGFRYEARVKVSSAVAERHRTRSKNFFYVMLVAQAGVTVSAIANARRKKNLFWSLASAAGIIAVVAGVYVYLAL